MAGHGVALLAIEDGRKLIPIFRRSGDWHVGGPDSSSQALVSRRRFANSNAISLC